MSLMSDRWIQRMVAEEAMISPFIDHQVRDQVISYGLSGYGYDIRLGYEFKIFDRKVSDALDPKNFPLSLLRESTGETCELPPYGFMLSASVEYIRVPQDTLVVCVGKSTYARCGLFIGVTPLEPGWEGHITLEVFNSSPLPIRLYGGEGICQCLFFKGNEPCQTSYSDRDGKYMRQTGITLPRI